MNLEKLVGFDANNFGLYSNVTFVWGTCYQVSWQKYFPPARIRILFTPSTDVKTCNK
jgi:hypothetical protein